MKMLVRGPNLPTPVGTTVWPWEEVAMEISFGGVYEGMFCGVVPAGWLDRYLDQPRFFQQYRRESCI